MICTINQFVESVTNADSLFATLRDITPKEEFGGRTLAKFKRGVVVMEVEHEGKEKLLLCSTQDENLLRNAYIEYSSLSESATDIMPRAEFFEQEMTLFDARGVAQKASVLLLEGVTIEGCGEGETHNLPPQSHLCRIIEGVAEGGAQQSAERRVDREGVVCHQTSQGVCYTDWGGVPLFDMEFLWGEPMREGRAEVETESGRGLISKSGEFVLQPIYDELMWDEMTGVCIAMRDGVWAMYDREGVRLTTADYEWIGEPTDGLFPMIENDRCGFLSPQGCEVIASEWDEASSFGASMAEVKRDGATYIIDNKGFVVK